MSLTHFAFLVLGGGSAGYAAARTFLEHGEGPVAVVDGSPELGGLCILRGCMPSKTLLYSAEVLHLAQKGRAFGLDIPEARADMKALHERKLRTIGEFADYRQEQLQDGRFELFRTNGRFAGENTVELDDGTRLSADHILVSTGSTVQVPPIPGLTDVPFWTSDQVLELDFVPESVIVLGGGIVACELAQFLRRIGAEVIQVQRSPHILKEMSPEAAIVIEEVFREEGIELYTGTMLDKVERTKNGVQVSFQHDGERIVKEAKYLFNALGRTPNVRDLQLEKADIETHRSGHIVVNGMQQTANAKVYAAGDVAGPHEIVHLAIMQGEVAAKHAAGQSPVPVNYDTRTGVVFTDPQIGTAGLTEKEIRERGIDYVSADYPFDDHGKSILMEAKHGYVKAFARKPDGKILGAEVVGKDGGELMHAMMMAIELGVTVEQALRAHWYHPTLSEIWSYPLEDCLDALKEN